MNYFLIREKCPGCEVRALFLVKIKKMRNFAAAIHKNDLQQRYEQARTGTSEEKSDTDQEQEGGI